MPRSGLFSSWNRSSTGLEWTRADGPKLPWNVVPISKNVSKKAGAAVAPWGVRRPLRVSRSARSPAGMPSSPVYFTVNVWVSLKALYLPLTFFAFAVTTQEPFFLPSNDTFPDDDVVTVQTSLPEVTLQVIFLPLSL